MDSRRRGRLSEWLLAGCTLILAAALILQCLAIYRAGTAPENLTADGVRIQDVYSREIVAARLSGIAWAFVLWLAALAVAVADRIAHPGQGAQSAGDVRMRLELYRARVEATAEMEGERRKRRRVRIAAGCLCAACALGAGVYLFNREHFTSWDLEIVMGAMAAHVFPWIAIAFVVAMISAQLCDRSRVREIELAKGAPKKTAAQPSQTGGRHTGAWRTALLLASVGLIVAGILNGGMYDVLVKAVNICTECIGLG